MQCGLLLLLLPLRLHHLQVHLLLLLQLHLQASQGQLIPSLELFWRVVKVEYVSSALVHVSHPGAQGGGEAAEPGPGEALLLRRGGCLQVQGGAERCREVQGDAGKCREMQRSAGRCREVRGGEGR